MKKQYGDYTFDDFILSNYLGLSMVTYKFMHSNFTGEDF
jgi:hypothetical protein